MDNSILKRLNRLLGSGRGSGRLLSGWVVLSLVGTVVLNCEVAAASQQAHDVSGSETHALESSHRDPGYGHKEGSEHCPDLSSIDIASGKSLGAEKSDLNKYPAVVEPFFRIQEEQYSVAYHSLEVEHIVSSPPRYLVLKRLLIDHLPA